MIEFSHLGPIKIQLYQRTQYEEYKYNLVPINTVLVNELFRGVRFHIFRQSQWLYLYLRQQCTWRYCTLQELQHLFDKYSTVSLGKTPIRYSKLRQKLKAIYRRIVSDAICFSHMKRSVQKILAYHNYHSFSGWKVPVGAGNKRSVFSHSFWL